MATEIFLWLTRIPNCASSALSTFRTVCFADTSVVVKTCTSDTSPESHAVHAPPLYLIFQNQRFLIDKDQFIIGRGAKSSDLPIRDGNISRKHAAVIRRNGTFYIKDLGSTNGIDYKGMRIDNKRIDEGDVFHLCDYELRFTYRAD